MEELKKKIEELPASLVAEAVKNLRLSLQYEIGKDLSDDEIKQNLQQIQAEGETDLLRQAIVSESASSGEIERWGKSMLLYLAADEELQPQIEEAIEDARASGVKAVDPGSLIFIGALLVLLKYRPSKIVRKKDEFSIEWKDNNVGIVSKLAALIFGSSSSS